MKSTNYKICSHCGAANKGDSKFCEECGFAFSIEVENDMDRKILKCPACGELLSSFDSICPSCGTELIKQEVSNALKSFIKMIEECDKNIINAGTAPKKGWSSWSFIKKIGWVLLNLFFAFIPLLIYLVKPLLRTEKTPNLTSEEKYKAKMIENYAFPNDRGTLLEGLLYIKSRIDFLSTEKTNANNAYWIKLWTGKAEQLYRKAEASFPGDTTAKQLYDETIKKGKQARKKQEIKVIVTIGAIVLVLAYAVLSGNQPEQKNYDATYEWPSSELAQLLPEPDIEYGKITSESPQQFQFELYDVSPADFDSYVKACRNHGFDDDVTKNDDVFYAKNAQGYDLNFFYYYETKELHISLDSYDIEEEKEQ